VNEQFNARIEADKARIAAAKEAGNVFIAPSGPMCYEELPQWREGRRFAILVDRHHTERDINHAKRILRNSKDATAIQVHRIP